MPARSVAFANLRGGCGKSTILFQLAAEFAKANASTGVLVIDCTAFGDVSRLLLGGRQPHVKAAVGERHADGKSTAHLMSHLLTPPAAAPVTPGHASARGAASLAAGGAFNIAERFGLPVREVNPHIPLDNLLLIPSGATKQQPCSGAGAADILRLARSLRARLESLPGDWQVFLDTDGDLTFSPATEVALRTADLCYIPYQPTESDHDRATEAVSRLQRLQPPGAKVGGVLYNMVTPEPRASSEGWHPYSASFRPHEVAVRRLVGDFSDDWWARAQAQPASFAATTAAQEQGEQQQRFLETSVMLMQDFGKPGNLAAELGIPFCAMDATARYTAGKDGRTESLGGSKKLSAVAGNVQELRLLLEAAQARLGATAAQSAALDSALEAAAVQAAQAPTQEAEQQQQQQQKQQPQQPQLAAAAAAQEAATPQQQEEPAAPGAGIGNGSTTMMALAAAALVAVAPAAAPAAALAAAVIAGKQWMKK
ncbi:ATPase domain [Chlorella sorokiniana]|uniref:ATPase domain n=1 Tax=Chlorella sorokiniana TaxID=3076 RepID=A0A2P6TM59_CHLSO|nr:ATPase domain [Chlorella sorokiniana]|eukprot:PRW45418.1 ATPase domain [Chlorella sorokiniana]